ncbi:hypothetical protein HYC85_008533 [Camellia sinensis]|uniref:Uncharacterized protein n=1 Tax=Camellia sinensis TaxID=4442 RepID=A0A7J7HTF6_CAMSI|nr:hypothetical protein HYC85_008533 [Camellia sinensis]
MAATRLLRTSGPLGLHLPSSSSSSYCSLKNPTLSSTITNRSREGENREKRLGGGGVGEKKPLAAVKAVAGHYGTSYYFRTANQYWRSGFGIRSSDKDR